jgi:hypothetical protein
MFPAESACRSLLERIENMTEIAANTILIHFLFLKKGEEEIVKRMIVLSEYLFALFIVIILVSISSLNEESNLLTYFHFGVNSIFVRENGSDIFFFNQEPKNRTTEDAVEKGLKDETAEDAVGKGLKDETTEYGLEVYFILFFLLILFECTPFFFFFFFKNNLDDEFKSRHICPYCGGAFLWDNAVYKNRCVGKYVLFVEVKKYLFDNAEMR